jgi:hypothetical protein
MKTAANRQFFFGQLSVPSPIGGGTRLDATIPVDAQL